MGCACSTWKCWEMCATFQLENMKETDCLEGLCVDRIILK